MGGGARLPLVLKETLEAGGSCSLEAATSFAGFLVHATPGVLTTQLSSTLSSGTVEYLEVKWALGHSRPEVQRSSTRMNGKQTFCPLDSCGPYLMFWGDLIKPNEMALLLAGLLLVLLGPVALVPPGEMESPVFNDFFASCSLGRWLGAQVLGGDA